jgi:hypothetical protein
MAKSQATKFEMRIASTNLTQSGDVKCQTTIFTIVKWIKNRL